MLELVERQANAFEYLSCTDNWIPFPPGATVGYNGMCGTGKPYMETVIILDSFVYDHINDRYRFICWMNQANWPSWKIKAFHFHPETAQLIDSVELTGYAVAHAWTEPMYNGGLNGLYAGYLVTPGSTPGTAGYGIVSVTLPDGIPTQAMIDNYWVNYVQIPDLAAANMGFAICPERQLITVLSINNGMAVYDYSAKPGLATKLYWQPLHESFAWGMAYENDMVCWTLLSDSVGGSSSSRQTLVKYNYFKNRIELVSELQVLGGADRFGQIAFDTKRKKIAAIRIKADNPTTGAANNAFEIYSPRPVMTKITVPVNISKISEDEPVTFVTHLLGTKGEAGGNKEIVVSCSPTAGLIKQPKLLTGNAGNALIKVTPTAAAATETITVSYDETKVSS